MDNDNTFEIKNNDSEFTEREIEEVYEEIFAKAGVSDSMKEEITRNIRRIMENPDTIETFSPEEKEWYYSAYDYLKSKKKVLRLTPSKQREAGVSNYVYIAVIVLFIAFAIFMYIIFRR